jgi:hypothetical protein
MKYKILIFLAVLLLIYGCETTKTEPFQKFLDNSEVLLNGSYKTFFLEPEWDFPGAGPAQSLNDPRIKNKEYGTIRMKEALEEEIRTRFEGLGLKYSESDYDLHIIYYPFLNGSKRPKEAQLLLIGYNRKKKEKLFHVLATHTTMHNLDWAFLKERMKSTILSLDVMVQPVAGADSTR